MVNFLLPITFFSKNYTNSLAETVAMIAFPTFLAIILIQLYRYPDRLKLIVPSKMAIGLTGFFWLIQLGTMAWSYSVTGETILTTGIIHSGIILAGWTVTVYVAWAIIQLTIISEKDERSFLKSGLIALAIYLLLTVLPQILVTFHFAGLKGYVNEIAQLFERHWRTHQGYNFYANGSYVTTEGRVNGFEPEAAFLANLIGVVYLPILIGLTATGQKFWNWTKSKMSDQVVNTVFALVIFVVLFLAKTTTGILTAGIAYVLWAVFANKKLRRNLVLLAIVGVILIAVAYLKVGVIHNTLNQFLFAKQGTDNRLGGTIALALTFLTHPIFGVGYGFTSFFILKNVPISTTDNFEFQHVYSQFGYPNLSDFLGWFASFGLIIMIPAMWLFFRLIARTFLVKHQLEKIELSENQMAWHRGLIISFITMIILEAFSSIFVIQVFLWPYLLMFFFYRKHIIRLEEELK
ncbi:hypothetical protein FPFC_012200 [Fructobacillus pseudoficulneus]|uniref:Uncharacterized protein n=1 Tax=Fructobacillus pseudoficulneus TaxID=220714 RepID=A0A3F3H2C2_9LACO|nr:O-antigen ligase family protein [Fructobacillus pseudoficulneus]GAP02340.1 hypothetical protein FPFC_012200 [Fructobacillus pseudoficulneus]SEH36415.1 hypothetical protein SAMN05660469_0292 [Fructobacillus pseudoficulneus]